MIKNFEVEMTILNENRTIFDEIMENQVEFGIFLPFLGDGMIFLDVWDFRSHLKDSSSPLFDLPWFELSFCNLTWFLKKVILLHMIFQRLTRS